MTGLVRKAAVLAACGVVFGAAVAFAGVPSPANSTIPARINLVGANAGVADAGAQSSLVTITVRDLAANPIANSSVVLDFTGNVSDTRIGDATSQLYAGVVANCGTHGVSSLTDALGVATFVVMGGGKSPTGAAHAAGAAKIYADGVLLGTLNVGSYDLNGVDGVTLADLALWAADYFGAGNPDRADYNNAGGVDLVDLSTWGATYFAGGSNTSSTTYCP
ncbi:MAG: hypothetical protein IT347_07005 [Candidatus Eisenbacteria bacterium]|nr:hypothetical protein [Candidatus Eisenbacteria bacterium]